MGIRSKAKREADALLVRAAIADPAPKSTSVNGPYSSLCASSVDLAKVIASGSGFHVQPPEATSGNGLVKCIPSDNASSL
jgi:hypothetical protein